MKRFDVLDRQTTISGSYLLEASAGTGKTFTIEHLFVRLLLEGKAVGEILVVTFTKAATRELRVRIRQALATAIHHPPPYMEENGDRFCLKRALAAFDEAQILTLHGFCYEMLAAFPLESDLPPIGEEEVSREEKLQVMKDFFRFGFDGTFSTGQLDRVLRWAGNDVGLLAREILREVERGGKLTANRAFDELARAVKEQWIPLPPAKEMFEVAKRYKGLADRLGQLKPEVVSGIEQFAAELPTDFDRWISEGNPFLEKVVMGDLKAKAERGPLETALEPLAKLLAEASNPLNILAQMAISAREMLRVRLSKGDRLTFDGMLEAMDRATQRENFCEAVRGKFTTAIVDEFQDTDPLQWAILQRLFGERQLILVGDPKQSIYAFRNADIYSYLSALDALGEGARFSLGTNYRSRPSLVSGLNTLFSPDRIADPIPLPERDKGIGCPPVEAGVVEDHPLSIEGAIQFFVATGKGGRRFPTEAMEREQFLPFIGREIGALVDRYDLPYSHFAILVHDRYQAKRVASHLGEWAIPTTSVRGIPPAEHPLFWPLYHVIAAALDPDDGLKVRTALASPLLALPQQEWDGEAFGNFRNLHKVLRDRGFFPFFERLMGMAWRGYTTRDGLLARGERLSPLYELASLIADANPPDLLSFFHRLEKREDERLVLRDTEGADGVQVLTTFASKGLEFGVVFALALVMRSGGSRGLVPYRQEGKTYWSGEGGAEEERRRRIEEEDAEKMRLFYVAVTRAKDRVYVPVGIDEGSSEVALGRASPVELYFAKTKTANHTLPLSNVKRLDIVKPAIVREIEEGIVPVKRQISAALMERRAPLPSPKTEMQLVQSFSSLANESGNSWAVDADGGEFQELPAGTETGILVHELLEKIPPNTKSPLSDVKRLARGRLVGWEETLSRMVEGAFRGDLGGFSLQEVDAGKRLTEGDFLYTASSGMITGIVDLFFAHEGKSYLLDWKSNRLPNYAPKTVREEMARRDYYFQAKLYAEAADRYLNLVDGPPLAGFYYLFLRGFAAGNGGLLFLTAEELG